MRISRLCVFCGSSPGAGEEYAMAARALAATLVEREITLVYGGGSVGLMGEVADAVLARGGEAIGVLPAALDRREVAHRALSELHVVDTMHERKATMASLSDAFVALPGGVGTIEEVIEALTWTQLGLHDKPVGLLDVRGFWHDLASLLDHAVRERFLSVDNRRLLLQDVDAGALIDALSAWERSDATKWLDRGGRVLDALPPRGPLVGASAVVVRDGRVLLGRRRGAHGAGTWAFPGGKVDPGEAPAAAAVRELDEETGLRAGSVTPIAWTSDLFDEDGLHYVTLHHRVAASGTPTVREGDKVEEWSWFAWRELPEPLFLPVRSLVATGWQPAGAPSP